MWSSSSNKNSASALASSVLPTPVGPRKMKLPTGRFTSFSPARARRMASDSAVTAEVLAYHAPVQPLFQAEQPFRFALHEPRDRDARAFADQGGDQFRINSVADFSGSPAIPPSPGRISGTTGDVPTCSPPPTRSRPARKLNFLLRRGAESWPPPS